jgi:hypothetical protein
MNTTTKTAIQLVIDGILEDNILKFKDLQYNVNGKWDPEKIFDGVKKRFSKVQWVERKKVWVTLAVFDSPVFMVEYVHPKWKDKEITLYFFLFNKDWNYFRYRICSKKKYQREQKGRMFI